VSSFLPALIQGKRIAEVLEQMLHHNTTANTLLEQLYEVTTEYPARIHRAGWQKCWIEFYDSVSR